MQEEGPESKKKEKKKRKMYQEHPMGGTWKNDQQRRNRSRKAWSESQRASGIKDLGDKWRKWTRQDLCKGFHRDPGYYPNSLKPPSWKNIPRTLSAAKAGKITSTDDYSINIIIWEFVRNANSDTTPDLLNQELCFNKFFRRSRCVWKLKELLLWR